ncbi:MAG TPA: glycosyltransferase, partial [Candidatus Brocadiia bacterium]|nr:glycosyltransferase [Candidatus Brocadiia bacterium]
FRRAHPCEDAGLDAAFLDEGRWAALIRRPAELLRGQACAPARGWRRLAFWAAGAARAARLREDLAAARPDLLHAHFAHVGLWARAATRGLRLPMVISLRGRDMELACRLAGSRLRNEDWSGVRFLARSAEMAGAAKTMGFPSERVFAHFSGLDVSAFPFRERSAPSGRGARILSVGRLVPKKGMDTLLRALAKAASSGVEAELNIVGEGPELRRLRALASELGVAGRTRFAGGLAHEDVVREMDSADVFALACRATPDGDREGIPMAIKEALACGLPVVTTNHAGAPEAVEDGVSGLLAAEGDEEAFARALIEMIEKPALWAGMGRRGRERMADEHDFARLTPSLIGHYEAVISEAGT